jgi:hypothetical protein
MLPRNFPLLPISDFAPGGNPAKAGFAVALEARDFDHFRSVDCERGEAARRLTREKLDRRRAAVAM